MHYADPSAMKIWPNVPACYGWLSLDRRGVWRLRGEPVVHQGLTAFLNRQYAHDEDGNYFVQNGPQRVFVEIDYTPWVLRLTSEGTLQTHTGESVEEIRGAAFDDEGNLLLEIPAGIALLCDRDLPAMLGCLRQTDGTAADDAALHNLLALAPGTVSQLIFSWQTHEYPILTLRRDELARRFGFIASPQPGETAATE
jgi:hypothetical protein